MERLRKAAIITRLVEQLRENGSWCGETHIQKAMFFMQDMLHVPTNYDYVLYRHGPFSFDLRDELTALRGDEILKLEPQYPPYGPKVVPTERAGYVQGLFKKTLADFGSRIDFVAEHLGRKGVNELERLATAYWVTKQCRDESVADRGHAVSKLKPHIDRTEAEAAVAAVDKMANEASSLAN
jgi:hypothetical protein